MPLTLAEEEELHDLLQFERSANAKKSFLDYCQSVDVPGVPAEEGVSTAFGNPEDELYPVTRVEPAAHHRIIIEHLQAVEDKKIKRLMIFLPPGSGKSIYASVLFPTWFLGRRSRRSLICTSYGADLPKKFGRRCRNIVQSREFYGIMGHGIGRQTKAVDNWMLSNGSEYYSSGILGGITGHRADGAVCDDLIKGHEAADSMVQRDKIWEAYISDLRTRVKPQGFLVVIGCLAGDTPVLMADAQEKPLRDIRRGDRVATYENGRIETSTVANWINHGPDPVFKIQMSSGVTVKANARHPFLVEHGGTTEWRRTATLKRGNVILRAIGGSGSESSVPQMDATSPPNAKGYAPRTIARGGGQRAFAHLRTILDHCAKRICAIATELTRRSMTAFSPNRAAFVPCASSPLATMSAHTGAGSSVSITATIPERSGGSSATTAIWPLATERQRPSSVPPLSTFGITRDVVVSVTEGGTEDVFDIEVERTENFIANGLVSHNTRWHEDDVSGRILPDDYAGESGPVRAKDGEVWHVICIPAKAERGDDPLGREVGEYLWPEWFLPGYFEQEERSQGDRNWNALFQQRPAPEEGSYFRGEWFRRFDPAYPPQYLKFYGASDYAVTEGGGDYTVHGIAGVDPMDNIFILDWWRGQTSSLEWVETAIDLEVKWKPGQWAQEKGQIVGGVGPFLNKRRRERKAYATELLQFASTRDKATRARSIQGRMRQGMVYFPADTAWADDLISRLKRFRGTGDEVDDDADVMSLFGRMLDDMHHGSVPAMVPGTSYNSPHYIRGQVRQMAAGSGRYGALD